MNKTLRWVALAGLTLAPLAFATPAHAQDPTPEGTVITNTATASFTDANGNSYNDVDASVSVTVGFVAGPDVTSPTPVTPASPSTGNELDFTITNKGNGGDNFSVATTAGAGVTITGYIFGGTPYATIGELNTALASADTTGMNGNVVVTVVYTVAPGQGGASIPVELTATSVRDNTKSDASETLVEPPAAASVTVTPDGDAINRLPSNGTQYTATFTVQNTGNGSDTFDLTASVPAGTVVTIVSVNGTAGTSGSVVIAAGDQASVDVIYTVADVAAGTNEVLTLTATSQLDNTKTDTGTLTVTVIRPALAITKEALRDNSGIPGAIITNSSADPVLPGEFIFYKITVTNNGTADASSVSIEDDLPGEVTYISTTDDGSAGWTLTHSAGTVTATLAGTLAPSTSRYFLIRVQVK